MKLAKTIKLNINGGQVLPRFQGMRTKRRGGGQCNKAAQKGSEYCAAHGQRPLDAYAERIEKEAYDREFFRAVASCWAKIRWEHIVSDFIASSGGKTIKASRRSRKEIW